MYRLLATDIDGTLLAPNGSLPEANRVALRRLREAGVLVVFCSGRADISIREIASSILPLGDDEYIVSFNGARIVTADSRRVVAKQYISPRAVEIIASYARRHGLYLQGYAGDEFLVEEISSATEPYAAATKTCYRVVPNLATAVPEGSPKLLFVGDHELLVRHQGELERLDASLEMVFSKPHYLEIVARGVDKGAALKSLAAELGIPVEQTVAVGDAANDIGMLRAAGLGIAVANAREEVRREADVVLTRRADDGAIEEIAARFFDQ